MKVKTQINKPLNKFWCSLRILLILLIECCALNSHAQNYIWAKNIGSTSADLGQSIAVDGSGNVYITGYFTGTADFDPGAGTANLTSAGNADIFFAKYDSNGNYLWAKSIGSTADDVGLHIAVDGSGNAHITGYFQGTADFDPGAGTANLISAGSTDIFFAKYNNLGNYLWAKSIGNTGIDHGYGIAVDGSGNVHITGYFTGTADFDPGAGTANLTPVGGQDIFFAKYDNLGNYLWAKNIGSTGFDGGYGIAVDGSGNVHIVGDFLGAADFDPGTGTANLTSAGNYDVFFAKYDANGNYLWAKNIGSTADDWSHSIAVDAGGNVHITGVFQGTADFDPGAGTANLTSAGVEDIFFAKYDAGGNYIWAKSIGTAAVDRSHSIAVDGSGNVHITGYFSGTADFDPGAGTANLTPVGSSDIFFAKYDGSGNYLCAANIGSTFDSGYGIAVDGSGNVHITGYFSGTADFDPGAGVVNLTSAGGNDIFVSKYSACNVILPIELLSFTAQCSSNTTVKLQWSTATETNNNYFIIERSNDGTDWWAVENIKGAGNSNTVRKYEFVDNVPWLTNENVLYYRLKQVDFDGKHEYSPITYVDGNCIKSGEFSIFPNPATSNLILKNLPIGVSQINIIDVTGKIVYSEKLENNETKTNILNVAMLPHGYYTFLINTSSETIAKKFVKIE